jgi:hypothetical protein
MIMQSLGLNKKKIDQKINETLKTCLSFYSELKLKIIIFQFHIGFCVLG